MATGVCSDNPEMGIVRKHRTDSGLISYDARRDTDWPQAAREIIAGERRADVLCEHALRDMRRPDV